MIVIIKSAPDTPEGKRGIKLAMDMAADVCLMQNAVYTSINLNNNSLYVMSDDLQMRGIGENKISGKPINYEQLVDLIASTDKVIGIF